MRPHHQDAADVLEDADPDVFDQNGILKDGKSMRVSLFTVDADALSHLQRAVAQTTVRITDGQGKAAGLHRPGFRLAGEARRSTHSADAAALADAYAEYETNLQSAWRGTPTADASVARPETQHDAANHQQRMAQLYDSYDAELREAWRRA